MTWHLDPKPPNLYDIRHGSGKPLVRGITGLHNARTIADGLAERHRTEYGVVDQASGKEVHRAVPPERPREDA